MNHKRMTRFLFILLIFIAAVSPNGAVSLAGDQPCDRVFDDQGPVIWPDLLQTETPVPSVIPTMTPWPTITPEATETPPPTKTPMKTQTPTATPTMTPTRTPVPTNTPPPTPCKTMGVSINIPANHFEPNDTFDIDIEICGPEYFSISGACLVVAIEIGTVFWFWDGNTFTNQMVTEEFTMAAGLNFNTLFEPFEWPDGLPSGSAQVFAAVTDLTVSYVIGVWDSVSFSWS